MCLEYVKTKEPLIATKDIKVYKWLIVSSFSYFNPETNDGIVVSKREPIYVTPYRWTQVKIGETYTSILDPVKIGQNCWGKPSPEVEKGLHSFGALKSAKEDNIGGVICECVIPKGSKYYKGSFGGNVSYASDTLTYIRIIK